MRSLTVAPLWLCAALLPLGAEVHATDYAYVTNTVTQSVSVVDLDRRVVEAVIPLGAANYTSGLAIDSSGRHLVHVDPFTPMVTIIDLHSYAVLANIPVGLEPGGAAFSPDGRRVYVTGNPLTIVDMETLTASKTLLQFENRRIAVTPDGARAYVTGPDRFWAIDLANEEVVATVRLPGGAIDVAITPDGRYVVLLSPNRPNSDLGELYIIDRTRDESSFSRVPVGVEPRRVVLSPDGRLAYTANRGSQDITVVDVASGRVVDTISGCGDVGSIRIFSSGILYTLNHRRRQPMCVIDVATHQIRAKIALYLVSGGHLGSAPDERNLYLDPGGLYVLDPQSGKVRKRLRAGLDPNGIALTPDGKFAYTANHGNGTVSVIDTARRAVVKHVLVGGRPVRVAVRPDGAFAYVTKNHYSGGVSVIDTATNTMVKTIHTFAEGDGIAITADGSRAYVTGFSYGALTVLDLAENAVAFGLFLGDYLVNIALSPDESVAYIPYFYSDTVGVLDTSSNRVVATINLREPDSIWVVQPCGIAVTPDNRRAFVTASKTDYGVDFDAVTVVDRDSQAVTDRISLADETNGGSCSVVMRPDGRAVYIADFGNDALVEIDPATNQVVSRIPVVGGAFDVALQLGTSEPADSGGVSEETSPTPAASAPPDAAIAVSAAKAYTAGRAAISVSLRSAGFAALSLGNTLSFPRDVFDLDVMSCELSPSLKKHFAVSTLVTQPDPSLSNAHVFVQSPGLIAGEADQLRLDDPLPDGVVYTCSLRVRPTASPGGYRITVGDAIVAGVDEIELPVAGESAEVLVSSCLADCNEDAHVTVDEVVRAVNIGLGIVKLAACPNADGDADGRVDIAELTRAVSASINSCL